MDVSIKVLDCKDGDYTFAVTFRGFIATVKAHCSGEGFFIPGTVELIAPYEGPAFAERNRRAKHFAMDAAAGWWRTL
jgi:hypothetical protein